MFRRDVVQRLGGYDSNFPLAEDFELWTRIALGRFGGAVVPKIHLLQRVHDQRQSILQAALQKQSTDRAHERVLETLLPGQSVGCLGALMRLEIDPCGQAYERCHARSLSLQLHLLLAAIRSNKRLTEDEVRALHRKVFIRLGPGIWYGKALACLPRPLFRILFFGFSPALLVHFRLLLSAFGRRIRKFQGFYMG